MLPDPEYSLKSLWQGSSYLGISGTHFTHRNGKVANQSNINATGTTPDESNPAEKGQPEQLSARPAPGFCMERPPFRRSSCISWTCRGSRKAYEQRRFLASHRAGTQATRSPHNGAIDYLISVAASNIFSCTPDSPATSWACTPKGSVMLPLVTWPDLNPYTTGTSYSARTRMITCCKV